MPPISRSFSPALALLLAACANPGESPNIGEDGRRVLADTAGVAASSGRQASWRDIIDEGVLGVGWLKTFNDPQLEKIVAEALQNNRRLTVAIANLRAVERFSAEAGAALASAVAQSDAQGETTTNSPGARRNLQWELDIWSRLGSAAAESGEQFRTSVATLEAARHSLVAQTTKAWLLVTEANLQLALSQEAVDTYAATSKFVETRFEAKAAERQDIFLARADLSAAQQRRRQAVGALIQAMRGIEAILGRYPSAELEVVRELVPTPPPIPVGIPAELLERRPDLRAAERRVAAAFEPIVSAKTVKLPRLPLTGADGSASDELVELVGGSNNFSPGSSFVAPPDIGGEPGARVQIETAQQEAALAKYGVVAMRALGEVEYALTNEALLREREVFLAVAVDNRADALSAAEVRYDFGATDYLTVLQMQARALAARISLVRIENARLAQRVDLHLALGGGFED
jgi:NodT family efflux transporter outer membrane factor (OMF) lipoprotein